MERIKTSDNFHKGTFSNLEDIPANNSKVDSPMKFFIKGDTVPDFSIPIKKTSLKVEADPNHHSNVKITWFGHSTLLLELNDKKIFFDPMLGRVPAPVPLFVSKRFNDELPMKIEDIPELHAVLISHDHYDHLDYWTIKQIKQKVKAFYVPLGVGAHLKAWGVDASKIVELDWFQQAEFEGLTFTCTPSHHFSGRSLTGRNSTLWCSWIVKAENANIFFSGDSGFSGHFKKIGESYGPFDLTMLECGQYNPGWADIHMMPEQTVKAHMDLRGNILMPIHFGAFKLSTHPWQEPVERLLKEAALFGVKVTTPRIGEQVVLGNPLPDSKWWDKNNKEP
ncbi:MAG: MBL fold metallo-hydrolase [Solirubrobacterales bacterium]